MGFRVFQDNGGERRFHDLKLLSIPEGSVIQQHLVEIPSFHELLTIGGYYSRDKLTLP